LPGPSSGTAAAADGADGNNLTKKARKAYKNCLYYEPSFTSSLVTKQTQEERFERMPTVKTYCILASLFTGYLASISSAQNITKLQTQFQENDIAVLFPGDPGYANASAACKTYSSFRLTSH